MSTIPACTTASSSQGQQSRTQEVRNYFDEIKKKKSQGFKKLTFLSEQVSKMINFSSRSPSPTYEDRTCSWSLARTMDRCVFDHITAASKTI